MSTHFDMMGIFVNNLQQMVAFYRDVLGVEMEWDGQGPYAEFKHEGIRFSMYARSELPGLLGQAPAYPAGLNGTFELAIDLPHVADVDAKFERVVQAGGKPVYTPRNEPWGMRSSMIADPEGNLIEIGSWDKGVPAASLIRKLGGANMDIDLATPAGAIGWRQAPCPWNEAERTTQHCCAVKNVSICPYFCGIEYLDTVRCCYPHANPLQRQTAQNDAG